ncbi:hypothetical protein HDU76_002762 [Blyttiomyces sp. JEL0837]|nr:hypothetical protein HDU76_002762 [Blyttiomyces sp. JEL0837]
MATPTPLAPSIFKCRAPDDAQLFVAEWLRRQINYIEQSGKLLESEGVIEIEAKVGSIIDKDRNERLWLPVETECGKYPLEGVIHQVTHLSVVSEQFYNRIRFQSVMTMDQHAYYNQLLNKLVGGEITYEHIYQVDEFHMWKGKKVRVSTNAKTGGFIAAVEKERISDLNILMPNSLLDCRISINIEKKVDYPSLIADESNGHYITHTRQKDRLSYTHQAYQIDLTQVTDSSKPNEKLHELEIEVDSRKILSEKKKYETQQPNVYQDLVGALLNNGRLHQIEYAMEAVKQGSAAVGLRSKTHAVLVALNRSSGELASYQKKLFRIDDHMGIAIAGLTSDARVLSNFMRTEAMRSKLVYNRPLPVARISAMLADKAQVNTQRYGRRPYGVGLLIIGQDDTGPRLFEVAPSGNFFDYYAISIGARSQSAKTYLEKHFEAFADCSLDDLILHGLKALRETLQQDKELSVTNCSIAFVGADSKFTTIEGEDIRRYLDSMTVDNAIVPDDTPAADEGTAPMET